MPIGPITPGNYVTVTVDVSLAQYTSLQAPTATMFVTGADLQYLTLIVINVQNFVLGEIANVGVRKLDKIDGGEVLGPVVFSGFVSFQGAGLDRVQFEEGANFSGGELTLAAAASLSASGTNTFEAGSVTSFESTADVDFKGTGIHRPTYQGGQHIIGGELTLDASTTLSSSGTNVFASGSDTSFDGTAVLKTTNGGKFRWDTRNKTDADYTANGTNGYEDLLPDPATDRAITLANTGAALGQRRKFNAQNVTGSNKFVLSYGLRTWFLRNVAGSTVKIEFIYNGSGWQVDDWEEGGNGLRDG